MSWNKNSESIKNWIGSVSLVTCVCQYCLDPDKYIVCEKGTLLWSKLYSAIKFYYDIGSSGNFRCASFEKQTQNLNSAS